MLRLWRDLRSGLRSSGTSLRLSVERLKGGETVVDSGRERLDFSQILLLVLPFHLSIPMNSISVSFHPQKEPVVCPQCGSTARVARDLCLRCMLLLGIAACGDTSETLNDALSEIDVQDASAGPKRASHVAQFKRRSDLPGLQWTLGLRQTRCHRNNSVVAFACY